MGDLTSLPNIGDVLAALLGAAGIQSPGELKRAGSVGAALRIAAVGERPCASKLFALEGAIRGVRWHSIPKNERAVLWAKFKRALGDAHER